MKVSRRSSFTNIIKNKNISVQHNEKDEHPVDYRVNQYSFTEICNNYYTDNYQASQQTASANIKQLGLSDYSKRQLRDQYKEVYKQVADRQHGEKN